MKTGFTQAGLLRVTTPLGEDDLLLDAVQGSEGISELFAFRLHMRSARTDLDAGLIVGKPASVTLRLAQGPVRHLHGLVRSFVRSGQEVDFMSYEALLVPRLWLLTLSRDRRIHQGLSVPQILAQVLDAFGVVYEMRLSASYPALDYCVQYDESAFDFISRLMEAAGIFYYFAFGADGHRLVIGDAPGAFSDCAGLPTLRFSPDQGGADALDAVRSFSCEHALALAQATVADFDFEQPATALAGSHAGAGGCGEHYEFGAGAASAAAAAAIARLRVEASQADTEVARGASGAWPLAAGQRVTLEGHFVPAFNRAWVLRRVHHDASQDRYANRFEAFPAATVFRSPVRVPRPRAAGCETARVVGPQGEEIWTDPWGRIKVQFPWDRSGAGDETSSTWIRVAQPLAGPGFGALCLPRVGQEVVVTYVNGDPDRPLVTGCVYNADNAPPIDLPAQQTQTVMRTRSVKQGQAGNELRLEDRKDAEEIYLHAQKNLRIEVEDSLAMAILKGNELHQVKGTRTLEISGDESHTDAAGFTHTVKGDYALKVDGKLNLEVGGDITLTAGGAIVLKSGANLTHEAGAKLLAKAGAQIDLQAPVINSKADGTQTVQAGAILTLKGALTKVN